MSKEPENDKGFEKTEFSFSIDFSEWTNPIDETEITGIYEDSDGNTEFHDITKDLEDKRNKK